MRSVARCNPCYDPEMVSLADFYHKIGPWNLHLVLETYIKPSQWHGSISYFKEVAHETVYDRETGKPIFEAPKDAMLEVKDWTPEELDIARDLLAGMFGPLIHDAQQRVVEHKGAMALHWTTLEVDARKAAARGN